MAQPAYDRTTADGILAHARLLLGKSLRDLYPEAVALAGKGGLGQCVEKFHFDYQPNSTPEPDFPEAGVELKCTPMKQLQDGSMVAKEPERLSPICPAFSKAAWAAASLFWCRRLRPSIR